MSNEIQTDGINAPQNFEVELTPDNYETISEVLPEGFQLEANDVPQKNASISRKASISEDQNKNHQLDKTAEKISSTEPLGEYSINKRTLRDHSQKKGSFDQKSLETKDILNTNSKPFKPKNEGVKKCYNLLQKLKKHRSATSFISSAKKDELDLNMIENKLKSEEYRSVNQFGNEVRKLWSYTLKSSQKDSDIYIEAAEMSSYFENQFKDIEDMSFNDSVRDLEKKVEKLSKQITELHNKGGGARYINVKSKKSPSKSEKIMTPEEKKELSLMIKKLPPEHLRGVWEIAMEGLGNLGNNKEVLEFDIHALPTKVARELEKYVKFKLSSLNKSKSKSKKKKESGKDGVSNQEPENVKKVVQNHQQFLLQQNDENKYNMSQQPAEIGTKEDKDGASESSSFITDSDSESDGEAKKNLKLCCRII